MRIGMSELIVILIVALFVLGPDKLPVYAKKMGEALAQFRKYSDEATKDIRESVVEPLQEAQRPLREAVEPLNELDKAVRSNVKDVQKSFANIGKEEPKKAPVEEPKVPEETDGAMEEPETDPHVWEKRKRIPQRNGRCGSKGERECRQRGRLSTQRPRSRRAR